jgi:hypothetical protein
MRRVKKQAVLRRKSFVNQIQYEEKEITEELPWLGITANEPYQQGDSVFDFNSYRLAIVEFDDQGRCYDRGQMTALAGELDRLGGADALIVVFVHGWKHNGRSDDDN